MAEQSPAKKQKLQLSSGTLTQLRPSCPGLGYDRSKLSTGIVHLGIGAFHRAHQAVYTDTILGLPGQDNAGWGITGVSLRRPDIRDLMKPQDCLFTLVERGVDGVNARIIGSVLDILVAPEDPGERH